MYHFKRDRKQWYCLISNDTSGQPHQETFFFLRCEANYFRWDTLDSVPFHDTCSSVPTLRTVQQPDFLRPAPHHWDLLEKTWEPHFGGSFNTSIHALQLRLGPQDCLTVCFCNQFSPLFAHAIFKSNFNLSPLCYGLISILSKYLWLLLHWEKREK